MYHYSAVSYTCTGTHCCTMYSTCTCIYTVQLKYIPCNNVLYISKKQHTYHVHVHLFVDVVPESFCVLSADQSDQIAEHRCGVRVPCHPLCPALCSSTRLQKVCSIPHMRLHVPENVNNYAWDSLIVLLTTFTRCSVHLLVTTFAC